MKSEIEQSGAKWKRDPRKALFLTLTAILSLSTAKVIGPFDNGVPGSGYGCDNPCNDGDVNYVMRASLETYLVPGTENAGFTTTPAGEPVSVFTRTFTGVADQSSPFCNDDDGTDGPIGPCLSVLPGQQMKIKVINDMKDGMEQLHQHKASLEEYWKLATEEGHPHLPDMQWFGSAPETPEGMKVTNKQDIPGWDASYDDVNIHLHGMQVVPHLFYPQGTGNATADWITLQPVNENPDQQCFCYVFDVPEDHPQGTFFWHIHRHGSVAEQAWQGMVGALVVGDETSPGAPTYELAAQNVTREEPFFLWEWAVDPSNRVVDEPNTVFEGNFVKQGHGLDVKTTFLTNNEYQPTFDMCVNETVHFLFLCAQTMTGSAIYILDEDDQVTPFWAFASDGISYTKAYEKNMIVVGPGQREGLLFQFQKPGTYRVMQQVIHDFQGDSELDYDIPPLPVAFVEVNNADCDATEPVNMSALTFTPGMSNPITPEEVSSQISVNFQVDSMLDQAPVPQFLIDGKEFDYEHISHTLNASSASEWVLTSNMNYFHPFHIHVNPFQVKQITSGFLPGTLAGIDLLDAVVSTNTEPENMWRDTVFIPPYGMTTVYQRFGESTSFAGKTVYHCHFLGHEDQGMIAAMVIADPNAAEGDPDASDTKVGVHAGLRGRR